MSEVDVVRSVLTGDDPAFVCQRVPKDVFLDRLRDVSQTFERDGVRHAMIGGIASAVHGRPRVTHDVDVFVRPEDARPALAALDAAGFLTHEKDQHWLYKGIKSGVLVDVIFKAKGDIYLDEDMEARVRIHDFHGVPVRVVPPEDLVVIKAIVHDEPTPRHWHDALSVIAAADLDWEYLLRRARHGPSRVLSLLLYARSNDHVVPIVHCEGCSTTSKGATMASTDDEPRQYLIAQLQEALALDPRVNQLDIHVKVVGTKVFLTGCVPTHERIAAVSAIAVEVLPGHEVHNELTVASYASPEEVENLS